MEKVKRISWNLDLMNLMRVVWMIKLVEMKRVMERHKREDDWRVQIRVEVHHDSVVVVVEEDDCQKCQEVYCRKIMEIMDHD